ncbi:MAG: AtpZ/AtpI family protein [bacterium]
MKKTQSTKSVIMNEDVVQSRLSAFSPKKQFMIVAMNMGWQLAGAVLIPVIAGVKLDDHFNTRPSYTLAALVLACGGASAIVWNTIKQVNIDQDKANSNMPHEMESKDVK